MDVNNINPNIDNLQGLNPQVNLDRTHASSQVKNEEEDSYNLSISALLTHDRSNLALGLEQSNQGLAITKIAQNTLEEQSKILDKIENKFEKSEDQQLNNEDVLEVKSLLKDFAVETQNSKFDNKNLFAAQYEEKTITLSVDNNSLQIDKVDLKEITQNLNIQANKLPLEEAEFLEVLTQAKEIINTASSDFKGIEKNIELSAKENITQEGTVRVENSKYKEINFSNEVKDFSRTNIIANAGLIASQANIVQEQSVRLLSK